MAILKYYWLLPGDKVKHVGRSNLSNKVGEIIARVKNADDMFAVEFGDDTYAVYGDCLEKHHYNGDDVKTEPKSKRRSKYDEEEDY